MSWGKSDKSWGQPKATWHAPAPKKKTRAYITCGGCGHWVWEDRKVAKCYQCGGCFGDTGSGHPGGGSGDLDSGGTEPNPKSLHPDLPET
eukprot:534185-Heterocapsa_arctica.AAC.1